MSLLLHAPEWLAARLFTGYWAIGLCNKFRILPPNRQTRLTRSWIPWALLSREPAMFKAEGFYILTGKTEILEVFAVDKILFRDTHMPIP